MVAPTPAASANYACPRPSGLREPLLKVLARATNEVPDVYVQHADIIDDVVREAGFDPKNLPLHWDTKARSARGRGAGIYRNISLAFRYAYRDQNPPLTKRGSRPGQWGLTAAGLSYVRALEGKPLPAPKDFYKPILQALGSLADHQVGVSCDRDEVTRAVLTSMGVDPDNQPPEWARVLPNRQTACYEKIRYAVKAMREASKKLVEQPERGKWALTPLGVRVAFKLNGVAETPPKALPAPQAAPGRSSAPSEPNATAQWLDEHLTPAAGQMESKLYRQMRARLARHLPVSAGRMMLEDHIQEFMVRVIRRDAFARHLAEGKNLPYSKVVSWCVNSGRTDARDMGGDALTRTMFGALTEKERKERKESGEDEALHIEDPQKVQDTDGNIISEDAVVEMNESFLNFEDVWGRVEDAIKARKPQAYHRYAKVLAMRVQDMSTKEIAEIEGVSTYRAASMIADARRCVREARQNGAFEDYLY